MYRAIAVTLLLTSIAGAEPAPQILDSDYVGWTPSRHAASWTVVDGVLHAENDPDREGSTLWTDRDYADFLVELEFRFGEGRVDSGVFLRKEGDQIQLGDSGSMKRDMTASPYIKDKGYPVEAEGVAELLRLNDWNTLKVVAIGARYDVWLNGRHVMDYTSDTAIERGPVGLQVHPKRTMKISFRNVRITELHP